MTELKERAERISELEEALRYWLPKNEPFPYQNDPHCTAHRQAWHAARSVLNKETK